MDHDTRPDTESQTRPPFSHDVLEYEKTAREAVSTGHLLTAIEVAREGIGRYGVNPVLQQQLALALAQTGALDGARSMLDELLKDAPRDEETLCLLGRVHKELWRRASDPAVGAEALKQACRFYGEAFAIAEGWYPGINLAFTYAAAGNRDKAAEIADKVARRCKVEIAKTKDAPDGWLFATLAEALTHQRATTAAADYYRQAAAVFKGRWRDLASMRRQAREIIGFAAQQPEVTRARWFDLASIQQRTREALGRSEKGLAWLDRCFSFPSVVVFSGHMLDQPGRDQPRFPSEREPQIRAAIRAKLDHLNPGFGYASAASGADIIFCEYLLERDAKLHLVLPCPVDAFKRLSVNYAGPDWVRRFHAVLGSANTILVANPDEYTATATDPVSPMGFLYANRIVTGLAVLQAQALDFELHAFALWDGKPGDGAGGTSSVVADWQRRQLDIQLLHPDGQTQPMPINELAVTSAPTQAAGDALEVRHEIRALLSVEIVNFKKIAERQIPVFIREFNIPVAQLIAEMPVPPVTTESWIKSHAFTFERLQDAALFALELRDRFGRTPWSELGLPADLGIRLVLHAGPIFSFTDPVLKRSTCLGSHVVRSARIEPITPPGQVFASQEFAALCSADDLAAVSFEFLGRLRIGRLFDEAPLYRLDRRKVP